MSSKDRFFRTSTTDYWLQHERDSLLYVPVCPRGSCYMFVMVYCNPEDGLLYDRVAFRCMFGVTLREVSDDGEETGT